MSERISELARRLVVGRRRDGRCVYDAQAKHELIMACREPGVRRDRCRRHLRSRLAPQHALHCRQELRPARRRDRSPAARGLQASMSRTTHRPRKPPHPGHRPHRRERPGRLGGRFSPVRAGRPVRRLAGLGPPPELQQRQGRAGAHVQLLARIDWQKTLVAVANKNARILWDVLARGCAFDPNFVPPRPAAAAN